MINWSQFLREVLPEVPGAPRNTAINAVRSAAIEFSEQTTILRKDLSLINIIKDVRYYPVAAGAKLRTVTLLRVMYDGVAINPFQEDTKFRTTSSDQEFPYRYNLDGPELLHLEWIPDANITNGLFVRLVYKPLPSADECDDILYDDWYEQIACGALARLQRVPGKQWSDAKAARNNQARFKAGINKAWGRAQKNHTNSGTRVQFSPISGGRRRGYDSF